MILLRSAGLAVFFAASLAMAAERPDFAPSPGDQFAQQSPSAKKRAQAMAKNAKSRSAKATSSTKLASGTVPARTVVAQGRSAPPSEASEEQTPEKPVDPFADEPEPGAEPAEPEMPAAPEEEIVAEPAAEPPPADMPAEAPETMPGDEMPTVESTEEPTRPTPPSPGKLPVPPRNAPSPQRRAPFETDKSEPPPMPSEPRRPQGELPPENQKSFTGGEEFYGEDEELVDDCMSCIESAAYGSYWDRYWDNYCPPQLPQIRHGTWVNVDYLMWWSRGESLPPLVTSGAVAGALNDPNLTILSGNDRVDTQIRSGGRLNIGAWLNPQQTFGIGASFLQLQNLASNFVASSPGDPLLARPIFNTMTGAQDSEVLAQAGILAGGVRVRTTNSFVAADAYFRQSLAYAPSRRLDLLYGWRYLQMSDSLGVDDRSVSIDPNNPQVPLGTTIVGRDEFRASNMFNGVQVGLMSERRNGIWSFSTTGKLSLGNMHQTVLINGSNTVTVPGLESVTSPGSLLAQPSNIGHYTRNTFGCIPEVALNLGVQITPRLRGTFGYSFMYINRVAQAARQVDLAVDPSQFGGGTGTAPTFHFQENSFWLQGLNFGLNYQF